MKRILFMFALVCLFVGRASAQTTITGTFLPQSGLTPQAAGLTVLQQVAGTNVCGQLDFVAYNASVLKSWSILWNGKTYFPQSVRGYVRCSDGALISAAGAVGLPIIPNTDAQPQGTLTWMSGGLTGSVDGTLRPTSWSEAKAIPDQTSVDWGTLPAAQIVNVGYQTIESQNIALNARPTVNFTGGMTCIDNLASNRTDCSPTSLTNPMTGPGDLLFGGASGAPQRLAGNTTATRDFLISQGTGSAAQAPFLGVLQSSDIPGTIASNTSGNAATATALAALGSQCGTGQYSTGITVFGNANCSTVQFSQLGGTATEGQLPATTVFTDVNAQFGAHNYDFGIANSLIFPKSADPGSPTTAQIWVNGAALKFEDNAGSPAVHTVEVTSNKNAANGYAGLNGSSVVPPAEIPTPTSASLGGVDSYTGVTHQFINALSTSGVFASAQPAFSDLTGTASAAQIPNPTVSTIGGVEAITCTNQFLASISTSGVPACATVPYSALSGTPALPQNQTATAGQFITAYNSSTGAFTQAGLPNPSSGTLGGVESLTVVAHNFLTGISTSGVPTQAQPAFADISGTVAATQLPTPGVSTLGGIESFAPVTHQWIASISTSGVASGSQPTFGDISGTLGASQLPSPTVSTLGGVESISCTNQFLTGINTAGAPACGTVGYSQVSGAPTAPGNTPAVTNQVVTAYNSSTGVFTQAQLGYSALSGAPTLQYQTIENSGTPLTQRTTFNFIGSGVSCADNSGLNRTDCTITGGGGGGGFYQTVLANGTSQVQQPNVNYISGTNASVNCTNNSGATRTDCTFSASSSAGGRLDQISSATATNTQNNTTFGQIWGWALTGSQTGQTFGEAAAATGSGNIIFRATTIVGSTAVPFQTDSNGNGVQLTTAGKLQKIGTGSIDATSLAGLVPVASIPNPSASTIGGVESLVSTAHQWINQISTGGVPSSTQPAFSDIAGSVAATQLPNPSGSSLGGTESIACTNQFLTGINTSGIPQCGTVAYSTVSGTPTLPSNTPATANQILTAYNSVTGAFTQAALPVPSATTLGGVESLAATSHFFLTSISTLGVPVAAQPAFTDISGSVAASQLPNPSASTLGGMQSFAAVSHQWINQISTGGVVSASQPSFADLSSTATEAQLPTQTVFTDQAATFGAHAYSFAAATSLGIPQAAGASPTVSGQVAYDSTANDFEGGVSGVNHIFAFVDSSITGNAATATALASTPTLCSTGFAPTGILANGNATGCAAIPSLAGGGDVTGSLASLTVIALRGAALPTISASTGVLYDNAGTIALSTSASIFTTGTLPHAQLPALVSGDIPNNGANTTGTAAALASTPTNCGAGNAAIGILANGNATGCFTPTGLSGLTTHGITFATTSSNATTVTPPAINGVYNCGYTVTGGVAVDPTCPQAGVANASLSGSSTSFPIAYNHNLQIITHDKAATGAGAVSLPTPTTLGNTSFITSYCNYSAQTDLVTPAGSWTINGASTLSVSTNQCYRIHIDPFNTTAWLADLSGGGGSVTNPSGNFTLGQPTVAANSATGIASSPISYDASQLGGTNFGISNCLSNADSNNLTCEGRAQNGSQTVTAQMNVGDASNTSGTVFHLPNKMLWDGSGVSNTGGANGSTAGAGAVLFQFGGTVVKSDNAGGASEAIISLTGANPTPAYMYSNNTGNAKYNQLEGVKFRNGSTGTTISSGIDLFWDWTDDNSLMQNVSILDTSGTPVLGEMFAACCATTWFNDNFNSVNVAGSLPFYMKGGNSHNIGVNFISTSADHEGVGANAMKFDDPTNHTSTANLFGTYNEGNQNSSDTAPYNSDSGVLSITDVGHTIVALSTSTQCGWNLDNTYGGALNVFGLNMNGSNFTFPNCGIQNQFTGHTLNTDTHGNIGLYTSAPSGFDAPVSVYSYLDFAEQSSPGNPASGFERYYADSSSHTLTCHTSGGASCAGSGGGGTAGQINYPIATPTRVVNFGFSAVAAGAAVTNTTTPTTVIGSFVGNQNVGASKMLPTSQGLKSVKVHATGTVSTAATNFGLTLNVLLGGTSVASITFPTQASMSSSGWELDFYITANSPTGATVGGCVTAVGTSSAALIGCASNASVSGLNFVTSQKLDVQATWGTASASNIITVNQLTAYPVQQQ